MYLLNREKVFKKLQCKISKNLYYKIIIKILKILNLLLLDNLNF